MLPSDGATAIVTVRGSDGEVLPGEVFADRPGTPFALEELGAGRHLSQVITTDHEDEFHFTWMPARSSTSSGPLAVSPVVRLAPLEQRAIDLRVPPLAELVVRCVDLGGEPIPHARVHAIQLDARPGSPPCEARGAADAEGLLELLLVAGDYHLECRESAASEVRSLGRGRSELELRP